MGNRYEWEQRQFCVLPFVRIDLEDSGGIWEFADHIIFVGDSIRWEELFGWNAIQSLRPFYRYIKTPYKTPTIIFKKEEAEETQEYWELVVAHLFYMAEKASEYRISSEAFRFDLVSFSNKEVIARWHKRGKSFHRPVYGQSDHCLSQDLYSLMSPGIGNNIIIDKINKENVESVYRKDKETSRSLRFYFKACYADRNSRNYFEDIQNLCTAFQIITKTHEEYKDIGSKIACKLVNDWFKLSNDNDKERVKEWFKEFYILRCDYTHGRDILRGRLFYHYALGKGRPHAEIARVLFRVLYNINVTDEEKDLKHLQGQLLGIFFSQKIYAAEGRTPRL